MQRCSNPCCSRAFTDHFSGPVCAVGQLCVCFLTTTFKRNDLFPFPPKVKVKLGKPVPAA